jgi:branched-chain amino acid transport system substrate-binding protein
MNKRVRHCACLGLLLGAAVPAVAGCGSSSGSGAAKAATPGGVTNEAATQSGAAAGVQPITDQEFSQGNPEKADVNRSGEVIRLGYTNDESGPLAIPAFRAGSEAAVKYINDHGGVNGAKIELDACLTAGTPESSINCANKFVEHGDAVYVAGLDLGSDSVLPILKRAGMPYVSSNAWGAAVKTDPIAHILETGQTALAAASFEVMKSKGVGSMSVVQYGGPSGEDFVNSTAKPLGQTYGIKVSSNLADPSSPNWASAVEAANATGAQAILGYNSEQGCTQTIQAAKQVAFQGLVFAGSCQEFLATLGSGAAGVYSSAQVYQPGYVGFAPTPIRGNMNVYEQAMKAAGQGADVSGYAAWSFSTMMELRSILETVGKGPIDAKSVSAAFASAQSTPGFLGPRLHCAEHLVKTEPTACRDNSIPLQVVKQAGVFVQRPVYPGNGFVTPEL